MCGAEAGHGDREVMNWAGKDRATRARFPNVCVRGSSNRERGGEGRCRGSREVDRAEGALKGHDEWQVALNACDQVF